MHTQAENQYAAFTHHALNLDQVEFRVGPELIVIDSQHFGETAIFVRQIGNRSLANLDTASDDVIKVVFRRLADHHV